MNLPVPFADDSKSASIDSLTIENGRDKIALYGSLDIAHDKAGLATAWELPAFLAKVVDGLQVAASLSDRLPPAPPPETVRNPFS